MSHNIHTTNQLHGASEVKRSSASQEIATFYGTWRLITTCRKACHLSLSSARSIMPIPPATPSTYWRSILTLSSHLFLHLPSGLFPPHFSISPLNPYIHLSCPPYMPRGHPSHSSFDNPNNIWWGKQIILLLIMQYSPLVLPYAQISSSAYVLPQCDKPGFTPIRNRQAKLLFCTF